MQIAHNAIQGVYVTLVGSAPPSREAVVTVARALMVGVNAQSVHILPYNSRGTHACVAMVLIHSRGGSVTSAQLLAAGRSVQRSLSIVTVHAAEGGARTTTREGGFVSALLFNIILLLMLVLCFVT